MFLRLKTRLIFDLIVFWSWTWKFCKFIYYSYLSLSFLKFPWQVVTLHIWLMCACDRADYFADWTARCCFSASSQCACIYVVNTVELATSYPWMSWPSCSGQMHLLAHPHVSFSHISFAVWKLLPVLQCCDTVGIQPFQTKRISRTPTVSRGFFGRCMAIRPTWSDLWKICQLNKSQN